MSQAVVEAAEVLGSKSYSDAVGELYALGLELAPPPPLPDGRPAPRRKWNLEHMRILCRALGDPQRQFQSVLIAGTNGKGSTAATLAGILAAAGYRTGLYTSPHLVRVNERMVITESQRSSEIPEEIFARLFFRVAETAASLLASGALPHHPSFFEVVTAIGFLHFAENKVDLAVLEVGLGGRLDATNVVNPLVSIITDIALDHQEYLGNTISEIAREKAGILRQDGILVTLPQHPEANQTIGEIAVALDCRAFSAADLIPVQLGALPLSSSNQDGVPVLPPNRYAVSLDGSLLQVDSPLAGRHQQRNLALAITTASVLRNQLSYNITDTAMEAGLRNTRWPGRLEMLPPNILLDVAHNPAGAWTLRAAIAQLPEERPRTLIFSCLGDKDLREMSRILFPLFDSSQEGGRLADRLILAPIANPRATRIDDLIAAAKALDIPATVAQDAADALAQARQMTAQGGLIVVTGSVYLVGAIRTLITDSSVVQK